MNVAASPPLLKLRVFTSHKMLIDEEVLELFLPSLEGTLGIFPGHAPMVIALGRGELSYRAAAKQESFSVEGGYADVQFGGVLIFTELIEGESHGSQTG